MANPLLATGHMTTTWKPALLYYLLVFGAGFLLGPVRVLFLVPRVGERVAELLEMPVMLVVIMLAARWIGHRYHARLDYAGWLVAGVIALGLLVASELALVILVQQLPVSEYIRSRDPVSGSVYLVMLLAYAAMPCLAHHRTVRRSARPVERP